MRSIKFSLLLVIVGFLFLIAIGLFMNHGGQQGISGRGADWAHHLSLIETLLKDGTREEIRNSGRLGEMSIYPPLAHWICALLSRPFRLPPPRMLQLLCLFFGCAGCILLGTRYVQAIEAQSISPSGMRKLLFFLLVVVGGLAFSGFGVFGHLVFNFFYPQFVATVMAMWALEFIKKYREMRVLPLLLLIHALGTILLFTHLLAALWFYLAACFVTMPVTHGMKKLLRFLFGFWGTAGLVIGVNPSAAAMIHISENEGVFGMITGQIETPAILVPVYGLALALVFTLGIASYKQGFAVLRDFFRVHAGFLSIVLLASANTLVLLVFHLSSWYSITKYLLIFACEVPILLISLWGLIFRTPLSQERQSSYRISPAWAVLLLILIQIPWGRWIHDDTDLLAYRRQLLQVHGPALNENREYPQFQELLCEENYYLAISILEFPRDARTMQWFGAGCTGEAPLSQPF